MRHKHADLIHAYAEGAEIERYDGAWGKWGTWNGFPTDQEFRIKPAKKPDVVRYCNTAIGEFQSFVEMSEVFPADANMRLTFSGETGELIKAEVLK